MRSRSLQLLPRRCVTLAGLALLMFAPALPAQLAGTSSSDTAVYSGLEYRMVGPHRGGRSTAVAKGGASDGSSPFP